MKTISNKKAASWTIATIVTPLAASMTVANIYIVFWYMKTGHQGRPPTEIIQRAIFSTGFLGLWFTVGLWWFIRRKNDSFTELFATRTDLPLKDIFIGFLLGVFWVIIYGIIGWPSFSDMFVLDLAKLKSVPTSLSAGFCEEFLFRGFVILLISRAGASQKWQIIWSSLAFGMGHIFWGPVGMLFTVAFGATFAVATLRRGNVWPVVIAHSVLNLCVEPALLQKVNNINPKRYM